MSAVALPAHARAVIIGGGIVGSSVAYYLTKLGWRDVVVLDQGPLFHNWGSTSHAPGLMFQHNASKTMCQLAMWSAALYAEQRPESGHAFFQVGGMEIASTPERWHELKRRLGQAMAWGLEATLIGPNEAKRLIPIMRTDDLFGALYVPSDCVVHAAAITQALSGAVQSEGATFHPRTPVIGIGVKGGRVVDVVTPGGRIQTDTIVLAAGIWGPRVGRMAGVAVPLSPVQHLFTRTTPLAELAGESVEVRHPILRHQDKDLYFRQSYNCYAFGSYRHEPLLVDADAIAQSDSPAILPFTNEHFAESLADARERIPSLCEVDLAGSFNGLFSFTPDGFPLLGEAPGVRGFWLAEAVWITHAGGVGRAVAEWITEGTPSIDLRECDVARFHPHAVTRPYVNARAYRQYVEVYDVIHPLQQVAHPRSLRVTPFRTRHEDLGAVWFESAGWERPHWFAANEALLNGPYAPDWPPRSGWTAQHWSNIIGAEHKATREGVALFDLSPFTKLGIGGPGAVAFLERLAANRVDRPVGRVVYSALLNERGGIHCDLTLTRLGEDDFLLVTGGATGPCDLAWLRRHAPDDGSVTIHDVSTSYCALGLWGPRARDVLQRVCREDVSDGAFRYFTARNITVGFVPTLALRVSYVGELGWELYAPVEMGLQLWDVLWGAGADLGLVAAGGGAFESLRLEKGFRLWGVDIHTEYTPYEAGLDFAVDLNKGDFVGRDALLRLKETGVARKLVCLALDDPAVVVMGKEPILNTDLVVGYVTSANFGYSVGSSIAYGYVPQSLASAGTPLTVLFFGTRHHATVCQEPLFDPTGGRMK
jgi:glycine cleavage system aminomethyltransferase T/glycine/D-amino acid oxidase-like deaminating enzyme